MDLSDLAALVGRPAVRRFEPGREVPIELVDQLVEVARWTGSARNRQPWRFVDVRDRTTIRRLSSLGGYAQFIGEAPAVLAIAATDNGFVDTRFDIGRVTQSLALAATAAGLGCCPATIFPDANIETARVVLELPAGWLPRYLLAIGYPASREPTEGVSAIPSGRLPVEQLLTRVAEE